MTPEAIALAADLVRRSEGCCLAPNRDPVGIWQIGWGARWLASGQAVTHNCRPLTQEQADALLTRNLATFAAQVDPLLPADATDGQAAACLDFAYNLGIYALKKSTLLRLFRAGDLAGAAEQFGAWVYGGGRVLPGLVTRRKAERALFEGAGCTEGIGQNSRNSAGHSPAGRPEEITPSDALNQAELARLASTPSET